MIKQLSKKQGFTIVELLVVIVVIGILAAITIVSYTGISKKASVATIQSDLRGAVTQLGIDNVNDGTYPSSEAAANGGRGFAKSPGTNYSYTKIANGYCISATSTSAGTTYHVNTGGVIESGGCAKTWSQLAGGQWHACGVDSSGKAYCWGYNAYGQVGNNSNNPQTVLPPTAVDTTGVLSGKTMKFIDAGDHYNCAIASDDQAYCWGYNGFGRLGNNSVVNSWVPVAVDTTGALSGKTIKSMAVGAYHTCVIASDDKAYCWGLNSYGQFGTGNTTNSYVPIAVSTTGVLSGKTIKSISTGSDQTCVIASDNLAYCWGRNNTTYGLLGDNSSTDRWLPVAVNATGVLNGKTLKSIAAGGGFTCAIASDDQVYCWGVATYNRLGNNSTAQTLVPVAVYTSGVLSGKTIKSLASTSGNGNMCVIASDDQAYCWGDNSVAQLGNNTLVSNPAPVTVDTTGVLSGKTIGSISSGDDHTCVITTDKNAYCWGYNGYGKVGVGSTSTTKYLVPIDIQAPPAS